MYTYSPANCQKHNLVHVTANQLGPEAIWNMDDSGLQLSHRPNKVLAQ